MEKKKTFKDEDTDASEQWGSGFEWGFLPRQDAKEVGVLEGIVTLHDLLLHAVRSGQKGSETSIHYEPQNLTGDDVAHGCTDKVEKASWSA